MNQFLMLMFDHLADLFMWIGEICSDLSLRYEMRLLSEDDE